MTEVPKIDSSTSAKISVRDRHQHVDDARQHLVDPAADHGREQAEQRRRRRRRAAVVASAMPIVLRAP